MQRKSRTQRLVGAECLRGSFVHQAVGAIMGTHFPFAIARHPSPYLLTENFRLEVQLEHVEMGIVGSIFPHIVG